MSWQHFQYGLASIARELLRQQLDRAQAVRAGNGLDDDFKAYQNDVTRMTEVPLG